MFAPDPVDHVRSLQKVCLISEAAFNSLGLTPPDDARAEPDPVKS